MTYNEQRLIGIARAAIGAGLRLARKSDRFGGCVFCGDVEHKGYMECPGEIAEENLLGFRKELEEFERPVSVG